MNPVKKSEDLSDKIKVALDKAIKKVIAEEKARNGYLVISDKKGGIKKVPAKDLYTPELLIPHSNGLVNQQKARIPICPTKLF